MVAERVAGETFPDAFARYLKHAEAHRGLRPGCVLHQPPLVRVPPMLSHATSTQLMERN